MSWKEFFKALGKEWKADKAQDFSAAVTYYGLLAVFPFLLFIVALLGVAIDPKQADQVIQQLSTMAPAAVTQIVGDRLRAITQNQSGGLLTIGAVGALWTASGGVSALGRALNAVYGVDEGRSYFKVQAISLGMTIFAAILSIIAGAVMIAAGPVADAIGGPAGTLILWLRFPVAGLLVMFLWAVLYYVLPDVEQTFKFITPGSVIGVVLWLLASFGFSLYVSHFGSYEKTYGTLGAVIIFVVWMYLSALVIVLGAEINAVIEHRSPEGKRVGAKSMADTGPDAASKTEKAEREEAQPPPRPAPVVIERPVVRTERRSRRVIAPVVVGFFAGMAGFLTARARRA
jgi:membrane protein